MEQRLGLRNTDLAEKEKELQNLKENYEATMNKLRERQQQHSAKIDSLKQSIMNMKLESSKIQSDLTSQIKLLEES